MMEAENLHLLIHEEIYLIDKSVPVPPKPEKELIEIIPIVFVHQTTVAEELGLLNKIIAACKLEEGSYKVVPGPSVPAYEKAVVFSSQASGYYIPQQQNSVKVLYSKPLRMLIGSKDDKARLWGALHDFFGKNTL